MTVTSIKLRCIARVYQGSDRHEPGSVIETDPAWASVLVAQRHCVLVHPEDGPVVDAAQARREARQRRASTWRPTA